MKVRRLFDLLDHYEESFLHKEDVLAGKVDGKWEKFDIKTIRQMADNISYGLMKLGVKKGDKIATISPNRPEWNILDMAILQMGAIHVPIYPTISEKDYRFILEHSEVLYIFVSGWDLYRKIKHIVPDVPNIKGLYTFKHFDDVPHLQELIELGKVNALPIKLEEIKASVYPEDVATIIYTSGTTGNPKGVMLSHKNILSNVMSLYHIFPVDEHCKAVSYLPLCHVYERTNIYILMYLGVSVYYAENMGTIAANILEIKPHLLTTVPRLLEKVYDKIMAKGRDLKPIPKRLFYNAVDLGDKYEYDKKNPVYHARRKFYDGIIFSKWRAALGGNMRAIVSGGAALQPRLARVFNAAGIPLVEGYGMTETAPVIACNTFEPGNRKIGTVGPPLKGVEIRISEQGEILVKGDNVMIGYFKDPEMTKETVVDGWMHTGDVGYLDKDGMLKITGRVKEIFKTSMGKYISPALIENKFKESAFIDQIMVVGENQKFAAAIITPDFEYLRSWCKLKNCPYKSNEEIIKHPEIIKRFKEEINKYNKFFGDTEKIKKFELINDEWSIETGEITANLKLKRKFIHGKYEELILSMFNQGGD
ncbi:MAG: long-chain fatty acid--CoA ligase [Bacteroidales bacterium]|nr:long-chain fatty acid--CoA ligase [Bacteroidales bacterium]